MDLFYTPEYAKTGDVIPFYNEDKKQFDLYYLKNWNPDAPKERIVYGWHRITTKDNRSYTEVPTNIHGGTGSVIKVDDLYHMFYCTFDQDPPAQWARHAVSTDLTHWDDIIEDKFGPDGVIYKMSDWRDPFVFWNEEEQKWWMLLAARENTPTERNGCVALCISEDLSKWEYKTSLYAPRMNQAANECPDLFKIGDWYYLVYSNYTDGFNTYYRMSRSLKDPWIRPEIDTFDGRAFYAAKTCFDGKDHYVYGWNPTRGENGWKFDPGNDFGNDYRTWNWGGSIVAHKIIQNQNGTLGVCPVESVEKAFLNKKKVVLKPLTGTWEMNGDTAVGTSFDGFSSAIGNQIPDMCCIKARIKYTGNPTRFGIALHVDDTFAQGYYLMFEPWYNRIQFRSGLRMYEQGGQLFPYAVEMERPLKLEADKEYELAVYIQGTLAVLYVNHEWAFGFRMYNEKERQLGFFVSEGILEVKDIIIEE
jgi:beta-fructofuranosidase